MGQSSSRTSTPSSDRLRELVRPTSVSPGGNSPSSDSQPTSRPRPLSLSPFSRLSQNISDAGSSESTSGLVRRRSRLNRARTTLTSIPTIFSRHGSRRATSRDDDDSPSLLPFSSPRSSRPAPRHTRSDGSGYLLPHLQVPDIGLDLDFDELTSSLETLPPTRTTNTRQESIRNAARSTLSDRWSLRPDRGIRNMTSSLRRRRSPLAGEDQAVMLSRLLSVAAAATAASLMGGDHRALTETRNTNGDGDDGTFQSFLASLQNGQIASALGQNANDTENGEGSSDALAGPMNFFRMFRFGSSHSHRRSERAHQASSRQSSLDANSDGENNNGEDAEGRMVPIIIVGIRSINQGNGPSQDDNNIPPFLEALSGFPTPLAVPSESNVDGNLRQPHRFSHRRRASMGGLHNFPSNYDSQRHHRSPERPRPWSTVPETPSGPRPPPSTPASSGLSAFSSGNTTPTTSHTPSTMGIGSSTPSRRGSFIRRATGSGLESTAEEPTPRPRTARQRRMSESDFTRFGSGSSRRNGVVEPDNAPAEGSRSWIIYVLGGTYPENHPLLTTPSLFTDSPSYEDMILLSTLLGPAKPPVASEADVASAPGLYVIRAAENGTPGLSAIEVDGSAVLPLVADDRCRVCLCDYEAGEEARLLVNCNHLFHRECIDQWLTTGRNSCPLCRGQGVDEKT
ncbi:hypothetical protein M501DRAFT_911090, partial [Patellaria atrata CBS 101060]